MKAFVQCLVCDSTGMTVHVFTPDGLYGQDGIDNVFNVTPKSAKDGFVIGEIGVILYPSFGTSLSETILNMPSDEYRGKSCLVFQAEAARALYRYVGFYIYDAGSDKLVKQSIPPSISTDGRILRPFFPSCLTGNSFVAKNFSRMTVGLCTNGRFQFNKEKGVLEKIVEAILGFIPIAIVGFACYCAYKTVCARVDGSSLETSVIVSAEKKGMTPVSYSVTESISGHNLTNLTIRVNQ